MVKFWDEQRKLVKAKCIERIKFAEKVGNGTEIMSEKKRLQKITKLIEDNK